MVLTIPAAYHNRNVIFFSPTVYCFVVVNKFFFFFLEHFLLSCQNLGSVMVRLVLAGFGSFPVSRDATSGVVSSGRCGVASLTAVKQL